MPPEHGVEPLSDLVMPLPDAVVRYAAHDDGLVDVHLPPLSRLSPHSSSDAAPRPAPRLLLLLHGGFWKQAYDRRHTRATAAALAREGFVVATPEYRRVGGSGGWPATLEDVDLVVGRAAGLLRGLGIDTRGVTVLGHSAGGHLALWAATRPHALDLVVGLAPVGDLRAAARDRLGDGAAQALLGGEPTEVPERYDAADPRTLLAERPPCPVRVVHGAEDDVVPVAHSRGLADAHPYLDVRVVAGADHFDVMNPTSAAWPHVLAALT